MINKLKMQKEEEEDELQLCLNELNKFNYDDNKNNNDEIKVSKEKAWEYLIKAEKIINKQKEEE